MQKFAVEVSTTQKKSFISGAAVLAAAVAVTKVLGALYKIPLGNMLDSTGMAHFYAAYNVYTYNIDFVSLLCYNELILNIGGIFENDFLDCTDQ